MIYVCVCVSESLFRLFSVIVYYKILNIVSCAIQQDNVVVFNI